MNNSKLEPGIDNKPVLVAMAHCTHAVVLITHLSVYYIKLQWKFCVNNSLQWLSAGQLNWREMCTYHLTRYKQGNAYVENMQTFQDIVCNSAQILQTEFNCMWEDGGETF